MDETRREQLIRQLRIALGLLESPETEIAEFDIGDCGFCFEDLDNPLTNQE